jgi:hypothetical protein
MSNASSIGNGMFFGTDSDYFKQQQTWSCSAFIDTHNGTNPLFDIKADGPIDGPILVTVNASAVMSGLSQLKPLYVRYWAAAPPTYIQSYSGSGMPYPSREVAFENTPNQGIFPMKENPFHIQIQYPNSYYDDGGKVYVPPKLQFTLCDVNGKDITGINEIQLGEGIPYRSLQWPRQRNWLSSYPHGGSLFYLNSQMPAVRTQEQILKESAYPVRNVEAKNFWGLKPPM